MEERETCAAVATEREGSVDGSDMGKERNVAVRGGPPAAWVGMRSWRARREESFARRLLHHSLSPAFPGQIAPFQELPLPSSNPDASFRPTTALLSFSHQPRCASPSRLSFPPAQIVALHRIYLHSPAVSHDSDGSTRAIFSDTPDAEPSGGLCGLVTRRTGMGYIAPAPTNSGRK